jgi:hypothetical protein
MERWASIMASAAWSNQQATATLETASITASAACEHAA